MKLKFLICMLLCFCNRLECLVATEDETYTSSELIHVEYIITLIIQEILKPMVLIYPERGSSTRIQMSYFLGETQRNFFCLIFLLHIQFNL